AGWSGSDRSPCTAAGLQLPSAWHDNGAMIDSPRVEGYAIVSEDGMLANAAGIMPDELKYEADQRFFEHGLDAVDVVVHGRHSHEQQPRSHLRRRVILTRDVPAVGADPSNEKALLW